MNNSTIRRILRQGFVPLLAACLLALAGLGLLYRYDNKYTTEIPDAQARSEVRFLVDGWEFYPDRLYLPEDFARGVDRPYLVSIGEFPSFAPFHTDGSPYGQATYRIRLSSPSPVMLSLSLPETLCASAVYVGGTQAAASGDVRAESYRPHVRDLVCSFLLDGEEDLIIQTANYTHYYSGIYYPPAIGPPDAIMRMIALRVIFYGFLCFSSLAVALSRLTIWLGGRGRRDRVQLYFGALCLSFAVHVSYPFLRLAGVRSVRPLYAVEDISSFLCIYLTICIVHILCDLEQKRGGFIAPAIALGMCAVGTIVPLLVLPAFPAFVPVYGWMVSGYRLLSALYLIATAFYGIAMEKPQARLILLAAAVSGVCLAANVLAIGRFEPICTGWQDEYGSFLLVVLFTVMMSRRSRMLLEENARLTDRLHEEVALRTQELTKLLEERKKLLSEMLHDLKSPLTSIHSYVQLIQSNNVRLDAETAVQVRVIEEKCSDLSARVRVIQELTTQNEKPLHPEALCLNDWLRQFHERNRPDVEVNGPDFLLRLPTQKLTVFVDSALLCRMLENLVYNAVSFTPPDGRIVLSLSSQEDWACIHVTDTGCGILAEDLPRVFDRLFTTRPGRGGNGLGLYICRTTALEHGGDISVQSEPGKGTTFTVKLPLYEP